MRMFVLALAGTLLAGCQAEQTPVTEDPTLHEVMTAQIDTPADELWDVANAAIGDTGGIDPAKMDDERWNRLADLADQVAVGAGVIAELDPVRVAAPGVEISDANVPGGHTAAQVQAAIDANPELLRELANTLGMHVRDLADAARAHDAARAGPLVDQLDGVCESCHLQFWYPEQRALVEQFQNEGVVDTDHPGLGPADAPKEGDGE